MERRTFIKSVTIATAATAANPSFVLAKKKEIVSSKALSYAHVPIKLKYKASSLNGLSEKLMTSHLSNNYGGAVKSLNEVRKKLAEMVTAKDVPPYLYNDLKREHLMRTGSVVNHELYFDNLGGNGKASGTVLKLISASFGSYDAWETEFRKIAAGLAGGSGWVVLGYNQHLNLLENYWIYDHVHGPLMTVPLLVMDMYEHSYHIDYGSQAAKYIDAFFKNIDWEEVNKRTETLI